MKMHTISRIATMLVAAGTLAGCSVDSLVDVKRPSGILDPDALKTYGGAIDMYNGAVSEFNRAFMGGQQPSGAASMFTFAVASGVLADEYTVPGANDLDRRADGQIGGQYGQYTYSVLAIAYLAAGQAIQFLQAYAANAPKAYVARMHLNRGYISLFMSELFCSGVPLSEAGAEGKVVYGTGLSTDSLQHYALAQFDSALSIFGQDTGVIAIAARMGRARAFLNLKEYDKAATEVANVPTDFRYDATYNSSVTASAGFFQPGGPSSLESAVGDNEGQNGLNFVSAKDPRVETDKVSNLNEIDYYEPHAWRASGSLNVPIESGINARLIEAEYLLSQGKVTEWLAKLNALRTTCASAVGCATPAPTGDGGVAGLPPLTDPGTPASRLQLMFSERGFWLFGTGHRQGDLRRLVRQYNIPQSQVYPTGAYIPGTFFGVSGTLYGIYTNIGLGVHELEANPNYQGCFDREA